MAKFAEAHCTALLHDVRRPLTPADALRLYYTFAQEQFAKACGNSPEGSTALYGLGKLNLEILRESPRLMVDARSKSLVFQQAALLADSNNAKAANELGVLLARSGHIQQALPWLRHSVSLEPRASTWHNLAEVYRRLGQPALAEQANRRCVTLGGRSVLANRPQVELVPLTTLSRVGGNQN